MPRGGAETTSGWSSHLSGKLHLKCQKHGGRLSATFHALEEKSLNFDSSTPAVSYITYVRLYHHAGNDIHLKK